MHLSKCVESRPSFWFRNSIQRCTGPFLFHFMMTVLCAPQYAHTLHLRTHALYPRYSHLIFTFSSTLLPWRGCVWISFFFYFFWRIMF
jgi:hypothetical protein